MGSSLKVASDSLQCEGPHLEADLEGSDSGTDEGELVSTHSALWLSAYLTSSYDPRACFGATMSPTRHYNSKMKRNTTMYMSNK